MGENQILISCGDRYLILVFIFIIKHFVGLEYRKLNT